MNGAILWAFYTLVAGDLHDYKGFLYYDMAACEAARPAVEREMEAHGYTGIRTSCTEVRDRN